VVVIEHNLDVIKTADWIIDLGPEGGAGGGRILVTGTPETVAATPDSYTGQFLGPHLGAGAGAKRSGHTAAIGKSTAPARRGKRQSAA
jgi:excinuclease ABC subunit A